MKKENKKKVVTLSAMAALLAVVLGMGGKTYAKYFTSNTTDAQTATVAKWGLVLNQKNSGENMFAKTYGDTVSSSSIDNVAAPGTSGSVTYVISGSAEVDAKITFAFAEYDPIELKGNGVEYYPIVWSCTIGSTTEEIGNTPAEIEAWYEEFDYDAYADAAVDTEITISWAWAFGANDGQSSGDDAKDTLLGQAAALGKDTVTVTDGTNTYSCDLTLSFQLNAVMVQVD